MGGSLSMLFAVIRKRIAAMAPMAMPRTIDPRAGRPLARSKAKPVRAPCFCASRPNGSGVIQQLLLVLVVCKPAFGRTNPIFCRGINSKVGRRKWVETSIDRGRGGLVALALSDLKDTQNGGGGVHLTRSTAYRRSLGRVYDEHLAVRLSSSARYRS
jgi:hypothetical protein